MPAEETSHPFEPIDQKALKERAKRLTLLHE